MVRITALMDNEPSEHRALVHEHGLSYLVEREGCRILFDCGAGPNPWVNAQRLGRSVRNLDAVVLSHSHYDHAAGYPDMVSCGVHAPLVTGVRFFEEKYARDGEKYTYLGCGFGPEFPEKRGISHLVCEDKCRLFDGCYAVGGFERTYAFEKPPARFVRRTADGMAADDFPDEICLVIEDDRGLIVIAGCSHPGILNMIETVRSRFGRPVYAIFGGSHLVEADEERLAQTTTVLRDMGISLAGFNHCTGDTAQERLSQCGGDVTYSRLNAGDCIFLP